MHPHTTNPWPRLIGLALLVPMFLLSPAAEAKGKKGGSSSSSSTAKPKDTEDAKAPKIPKVNIRVNSGGGSSSAAPAAAGAAAGLAAGAAAGAALSASDLAEREREAAARQAAEAAAVQRVIDEKAAADRAAAEKAAADRIALERAMDERAAARAAAEKAEAARVAALTEKKRQEEAAVAADVDRVLKRALADYPVLRTPEGETVLRQIMDRQKALAARGMYPATAMVEAVADNVHQLEARPKKEIQQVVAPAPTRSIGGCRWVTPTQWSCKD